MITVKRRTVAAPAILAGAAAADERRKAKSHYRLKKNRPKEFPFAVYRDRSVRDALEQLFLSKCAYCETKIGAADESEIEHWRPKAVVKEDDGFRQPGIYHWLASSWENLLLSCLKCNRPRTYRLQNGEEDEETWVRSGKGMLFPLAAGDARAKKAGQEAAEHPLLLDPCRDRPESYLRFVLFDEGEKKKGLVAPKGVRGRRFEKGFRSIDVYSLNRPPLVARRRRELTELQRRLADFQVAMETFDALPPGPLRENQARLMRSSVEAIGERLKPDSEYLLMTRQAIADFLDRNPAVKRRLAQALRGQ
jgi:uncharacterized protein (TIGR02646 family)